jgi:hypothetical protein
MSIETTRWWWQSSSRSSLLSLLVVALAVALPAAEAQASACGPNMVTYSVHYADGTPTNGIRCVVMPTGEQDLGRGRILWYGEGNWGAGDYRHIGAAWEGMSYGGATDVYGNGEAFAGKTSNLRVTFVDAASPPNEIRVTGDWNELWRRADSVGWTLLPRPLTCGPNYETYVAGSTSNAVGIGLRCFPKNNFDSSGDHLWLGVGDWHGNTYTHLGLRMSNGAAFASDLCDPAFGKNCVGSTSMTAAATGAWPWAQLDVSGGWNEVWRRVTTATYSSTYKAPYCFDLFAYGYEGCTSGATLNGRGPLGPEANAPNTIDGCADGTVGLYHSDESIDGLSVTVIGRAGSDYLVRADARIWSFVTYSEDYVDFYYAPNAASPVWTLIGTPRAPASRESTVSVIFTAPASAFHPQAIRAQLRYGVGAGACTSGSYNDRDDLVFGLGMEW